MRFFLNFPIGFLDSQCERKDILVVVGILSQSSHWACLLKHFCRSDDCALPPYVFQFEAALAIGNPSTAVYVYRSLLAS